MRGRSKTPTRSPPKEGTPCLHQMRNFLYQGQLSSSYLLSGKGMVLTDHHTVYAGELKHDHPHSLGMLLFNGQLRLDVERRKHVEYSSQHRNFMVVGAWARGRPCGPCLLLSDSHLIVTGFNSQGQVEGLLHRYQFGADEWRTYEYRNGQKARFVAAGSKPPHSLRNSPEHQRLFLDYADKSFQELGGRVGGLTLALLEHEGLDYLGLVKGRLPEGLGVRMNNFMVIEAGVYSQGLLRGYGFRRLNDFSFYEGEFRDGLFEGLGLFYSFSRGSYVVGAFYKGRCVKMYQEGRGRGREAYIRIKNMQVRNHPKVIHKQVQLDEVAIKLLDLIEKLEKPMPEEVATVTKDELARLDVEQRIDRFNQIISQETLSSDRLVR
jgi:hypothetical protein